MFQTMFIAFIFNAVSMAIFAPLGANVTDCAITQKVIQEENYNTFI